MCVKYCIYMHTVMSYILIYIYIDIYECEGYFCDSYSNDKPLKELNYGYAVYKTLFASEAATDANYLDFVESNNQIQSLTTT